MADYAIGNTGGSLRDAINALYPMTGLGEYNTMFPPQTGAPQPGPPVPLPQPRPQTPQFNDPLVSRAFAQLGINPQGAQGLNPFQARDALQGMLPAGLQGRLGLESGLRGPPQFSGGAQFPINPNLALQAGGRLAPGNYAARLGLIGTF